MKNTEDTKTGVFSDFERKAMQDRAKELRAEAKAGKNREAGEKAIQDAFTKMSDADRVLGKKVHELVSKTAPGLMPKTWYGMPAYANKDGKVVCFFQAGSKYESRYCTLGFSDSANLDDGSMWSASFALVKLGAAEEKKIIELVKKAIS
jgi:uncharacterized protein YdhG (YjbR/CyaY superfamily)